MFITHKKKHSLNKSRKTSLLVGMSKKIYLFYFMMLLFFAYISDNKNQILMKIIAITLFLGLLHGAIFAQADLPTISTLLSSTATESGLSSTDISEWKIKDRHWSGQSSIEHIYLNQQFKNLDIFGGIASLHLLPDGTLLHAKNQFIPDILSKLPDNLVARITPRAAIQRIAERMEYALTDNLVEVPRENDGIEEYLFARSGISSKPIPVQLMLVPHENELRLAWDLSIDQTDGEHWWSFRVDAHTGELLNQNDWNLQCSNVSENCSGHSHQTTTSKTKNKATLATTNYHPPMISPSTATTTLMDASYRVYPIPIESPNHGTDQLVVNPADPVASPYGWHDTDGSAGTEFTITRGNNVYVSDDKDGDDGFGRSPNGEAALTFDFPFNFTQPPTAETEENANMTDLFYWLNMMHDISYNYGFDEASGNFQQHNYGRGGIDSDFMIADALDGDGANNAVIAVPPDGESARMQFYIFDNQYDPGLDHGIVAHEYAHGITKRLIGGASTVDCLTNIEQMGEGWSDWYALMITMKAGDVGTDGRGIATYVLGQPTTGAGSRDFLYSTDLTINPLKYGNLSTLSAPYGVGNLWGTMLWELTWSLIEKYEFDPDLIDGKGGNNIALRLVTEALKMTPCSPGFIDARDAILAADEALYGGHNACEIWGAFAKRGLGASASQGSSNSLSDGTAAEDVPTELGSCAKTPSFYLTVAPTIKQVCQGDDLVLEVTVFPAYDSFGGTVDLSATRLPAGVTATFAPTSLSAFPSTATLTLSNTAALGSGNYDFEITGTTSALRNSSLSLFEVISSAPVAPTLIEPVNNVTQISSPNFVWEAVPDALSYELQIAFDPNFNSIVETISQISNTRYASNNAFSGRYYWRMRTTTPCGTSDYSEVKAFNVQSCGARFTDSGGLNGQYKNKEETTTVICPDQANTFIRVSFSEFNVEPNNTQGTAACYDHLTVYDGISDKDLLIGEFCGFGVEAAPGGGIITSTNINGCLTFVFKSDVITTTSGWVASISCPSNPEEEVCVNPIINRVDVVNTFCANSTDGRVTVIANNINPIRYTLTTPTGTTTANETGVFEDLGVGNYSVIIHDLADPSCNSEVRTFSIEAANTLDLEDITVVNNSCAGESDGSITVNSTYPHTVQYTLTPISGVVNTNTTGVFTNLVAGDYELLVEDTEETDCPTASRMLTILTETTIAPETSDYAVNVNENVPTGEGLQGTCGYMSASKSSFPTGATINSTTPTCITITLPILPVVNDLALEIGLTHTWIGDVSATLESPAGTIVNLFNASTCSQDDMQVTFWDGASNTATDFDQRCQLSPDPDNSSATTYGKEGFFQSIDPLSNFNGETTQGDWQLCFVDHYDNSDAGNLANATLFFDFAEAPTQWYDAPAGGNLLETSTVFDPSENGHVSTSASGTYLFFAQCGSDPCASNRVQTNFVVGNGLAVDWLNFSVEKVRQKAKLVWEVEGITETAFFTVEHSLDAQNWTSIGTLSPKGNTYTFWHEKPIKGQQFYRIQEISKSGQVDVSPIRSLNMDDRVTEITITPNPTKGQISLDINHPIFTPTQVQIYNSIGQLVKTFPILNNASTLDLETLPNGVYLLQIETISGTFTEKLVKQ